MFTGVVRSEGFQCQSSGVWLSSRRGVWSVTRVTAGAPPMVYGAKTGGRMARRALGGSASRLGYAGQPKT